MGAGDGAATGTSGLTERTPKCRSAHLQNRHYSWVPSADDPTGRFPWLFTLLGAAASGVAGGVGVFFRAVSDGETAAAAESYVLPAACGFALIFVVLAWFWWDYDRKRPPSKDDEDREREERSGWKR